MVGTYHFTCGRTYGTAIIVLTPINESTPNMMMSSGPRRRYFFDGLLCQHQDQTDHRAERHGYRSTGLELGIELLDQIGKEIEAEDGVVDDHADEHNSA